jgi:hypothetical protein
MCSPVGNDRCFSAAYSHHLCGDSRRHKKAKSHSDEPPGFVITTSDQTLNPEPCVAGCITFLGMMVGGVVWGNLSDRMGRRRTLMSALGVNAVFSVIAAFMPTYGTFMTARFCSAVGWVPDCTHAPTELHACANRTHIFPNTFFVTLHIQWP